MLCMSLEQMFSSIRGSLGCNNNPNVTQFKTAYKKILLGASKKTANYIDTMTSLSLFDIEVSKPDKNVSIDEFEWVQIFILNAMILMNLMIMYCLIYQVIFKNVY